MKKIKTVLFCAIVAEEVPTIPAEPLCLMSLLPVELAIVTTVVLLRPTYWEVCSAELFGCLLGWCSTGAFVTTVVTDEGLGQGNTECLDVVDAEVSVVLTYDK